MSAGSLRFRGAGRADASARLADVVASGTWELDVRALAARMLLAPPFRSAETPYLGVTVVREMAPVPEQSGAAPATPEAAVVLARRALEDAVDRALSGMRRVAVLTGGGLDSSMLLALAVARARRVGGSAFGVALDFGGPGDDRPHLDALAAHLGCEIVRVTPEDAAHRFGLVRSGVDASPLTWPGAPMEIELLAQARVNGADCALCGAGADDLFDGEPRALAGLVRRGQPGRAIASARGLEGFARPRSPLLAWLARPLLAELVPAPLRRWRALRGRARAPAGASPRALAFLAEARHAELRRVYTTGRSAHARAEARLRAPHLVHLAWLRHQEEVSSGLERRDPFLDPELVAAITRIPPELLLHGGVRRGLFREMARGLLPETLRRRLDKASFEPALARFVAASRGLELLRPLSSLPRLAALGLVDARRFREAFDAFAARPDHPDGQGWSEVWPALAVEAFLTDGVRSATRDRA